MKKNATTKIFAAIALFGIILSVVGTGALVIYELANQDSSNQQKEITKEQQEKIQKLLEQYGSGTITGTGENTGTGIKLDLSTLSGTGGEEKTGTGEIK